MPAGAALHRGGMPGRAKTSAHWLTPMHTRAVPRASGYRVSLAKAMALCLALGLPGWPSARAVDATPPALTAVGEQPARIEAAPLMAPGMNARPVEGTPRIEPGKAGAPERIEASPVARPTLSPAPANPAGVERSLRQLQQAAGSSRGAKASARSALAMWQLGLIYLHGAGVRRDSTQAQAWFTRAAHSGREPWAWAGLAWCAIDGCGQSPDAAEAARAIAQLRPYHPARADYLAWVLAARETPLQIAQPGMPQPAVAPLPARNLLERAAAAGDVQANIELGIDAAARQRPALAAQYFRRAGPNSAAAAADLNRLVSADAGTATGSVSIPSASAAQTLALARKYHRGEGVPANFAEAIRLYRLADARGSAEARRMLTLINARPAPDGGLNIAWMQQLAYADTSGPQPVIGTTGPDRLLMRDPTPLFDLLPPFWRQQVTLIGR